MYRIILALSCGLLIVVENAVVDKRSNGGDCEELLECTSPFSMSELDALKEFGDEEALDLFCGQLVAIRQCVTERRSRCSIQEALKDVGVQITVATYICSERGRRKALDFWKTDCANDELKKWNYQIEVCSNEFSGQLEELTMEAIQRKLAFRPRVMCPYVSQLKRCVTRETERLCGYDFSHFVGDVYEQSMKDEFPQCDSGELIVLSGRMLRRALPFASSFNRKK